ncbi:MAG: glycosyl hydrolase, partial [Oscillospiraceae bacterium]
YSGAGYISGFDLNVSNKIEISSMLPTNQHYNITLAVASDKKENNKLMINNEAIAEFVTSGSGKFEAITFKNVFINKGIVRIGIEEVTGGIDLDYIIIQSSKDVDSLSFNISDSLINENANEKTKNTMRFMVENFGANIISGQYAAVGSNKELDVIYQTTGRYPAMRLGDMLPYTTMNAEQTQEIEHAIEWSKMGGMVGYVWHWLAPSGNRSCYTDETEFDLSKAVTDIDISDMTLQELGEMVSDGKISDECYQIVRDIDMVSKQLKILQENNVTVLWRPLHEASGGWFWWGAAGEDAYKWLWELLYSRQTNFHGLNNLIWVWNAQMDGWYVGDSLCDVISADIYVDSGSFNSQINTFIQLNKISPNKLIALSECANSPSPDLMIRDNAVWSFFGVWCGDYVLNEQCEFSEKYITKAQLIDIYSHQNVLTLEKLPDLR